MRAFFLFRRTADSEGMPATRLTIFQDDCLTVDTIVADPEQFAIDPMQGLFLLADDDGDIFKYVYGFLFQPTIRADRSF